MTNHRLKLTIFSILIAGILIYGGCAAPRTTTQPSPTTSGPTTQAPTSAPTTTPGGAQKEPYGELRAAVTDMGKQSFDSITADASNNNFFVAPMYDALIRVSGASVVPGIAEKWEMAADGMSWQFQLRQGVKFHNGEELNADDIKFSMDRYIAPEAMYSQVRNMVERVEKIDDNTIRMYTKGPQPFLPQILSGMAGIILDNIQPKDYISQNGIEYFKQKPVGSGPYKYVRNVAGDFVEYQALDKHWRLTPSFRKLSMILVPEETTQVAMLKTGGVDVVIIDLESAAELEGLGFTTKVTTIEQPLVNFYGAYDSRAAGMPTTDVRVRQALSLAINRQEIIDEFFRGKGGWPGPAMSAHMAMQDVNAEEWYKYAKNAFRYDPDEAKKLLKEAGFADGFSFKFYTFTMGGTSYLPKLAEVIQAYWGRVGVKAEIVMTDYSSYTRMRNVKTTPTLIGQAATFSTSLGPVQSERMYGAFHSTGHTALYGTAMPEVDKLLDSFASEISQAKRKEIQDRLLKITTDSYVVLMIASSPAIAGVGAGVELEIPQPYGGLQFGYYLDSARHKK